ncbi:MAG: carboxypeptidase-like regulatory domain-containing protein [bacterium]
MKRQHIQYSKTLATVLVLAAMAALHLGCSTTVNVSGTVLTSSGKPVHDAKVVVSAWYPPMPFGMFDQNVIRFFALTDETGRFEIKKKSTHIYGHMDIEIISHDNYRLMIPRQKNGEHRFELSKKIGDPNNANLKYTRYDLFYDEPIISAWDMSKRERQFYEHASEE